MYQASSDTAALFERLRVARLPPHQLTLEQFLKLAEAIAVAGCERRWEVSHGRYLTWAESDSAAEALASVHRREVESALQWNLNPSGREHLPSIPSQSVLNDYPDLCLTYAGVVQGVGQTE